MTKRKKSSNFPLVDGCIFFRPPRSGVDSAGGFQVGHRVEGKTEYKQFSIRKYGSKDAAEVAAAEWLLEFQKEKLAKAIAFVEKKKAELKESPELDLFEE